MVLGIFKMAFCLRVPQIFMWQSLQILNIFNASILKQVFWKTKTFLKILITVFQLKLLLLKAQYFHTKLPYRKLRLRQMEWGLKIGLIAKNAVLPLTTLFFEDLISVKEPLINSWFDAPISRMHIFILFVSAWVLFEGVFSLWESLMFSSFTLVFSGRMKWRPWSEIRQ